jgi:hypothetical protein
MKPTVVKKCLPPAGVGGGQVPETARQVFAVLDLTVGMGFAATGAIQALSETIPGVGALHVDVARGKLLVLYDGSVAAIERLDQALCTLGAKAKFGSASRPDVLM